ncbi:MAG: cysteine hydrolase family protein, partial [Paraburkholderia sp.]|nr:cysteine hydrolase family protein [Paraburkholderia sp.]
MTVTIDALPGPFTFEPSKTALIVIDMQRDFIDPGGFGESLGNDVTLLQEIVPTVAALLAFARRCGWFVVHTR